MQDKTKNIIVTFGFVIILVAVFFINIIQKDKLISITERRKLAQLPDFNFESIKSGDTANKLEKYTADQFMARDFFRSIKSFVSMNICKQKDNNNLFEKDGAIYKMEYPINKTNIERSLSKINSVCEQYLKGMNIYYSIIPDKINYLENDDHLKINYYDVVEIAKNNLNQMEYIDIASNLSIDDYYKTDLHWKQDKIGDVVHTIQKAMNLEDTSNIEYEINNEGDFYGVYYGQLGSKVLPDKLYTLSNETVENCIVYNYESGKLGSVYTKPKTSDKYDIYLCGATSLISIENPKAKTEKELLLFRDSFGSSIAPLLVENYKKITLIDLRYISRNMLGEYINFNNQDVLFLYSTVVLNQNILK